MGFSSSSKKKIPKMNSAAKARRQAKKVNFISPETLKKRLEKDKNKTDKTIMKATKWFLKNINKASRKGFFEIELYYSHEKIFKLGRFSFSSYVLRKDYLLLEKSESSYIIRSVENNLEEEGFGLHHVKHEEPEFISGETRMEYQTRRSNAARHFGPFDGYHINSIIVSWSK